MVIKQQGFGLGFCQFLFSFLKFKVEKQHVLGDT